MIMIQPTIETLRRLRLTGMAKALEEQQGLPDCDRLSFDERLAMLVDREAVERDNAALAQRLRLAKLRQAACLEGVDYRPPRGLSLTRTRRGRFGRKRTAITLDDDAAGRQQLLDHAQPEREAEI